MPPLSPNCYYHIMISQYSPVGLPILTTDVVFRAGRENVVGKVVVSCRYEGKVGMHEVSEDWVRGWCRHGGKGHNHETEKVEGIYCWETLCKCMVKDGSVDKMVGMRLVVKEWSLQVHWLLREWQVQVLREELCRHIGC